jgi:hypothetical protein
VRVGVEVVEGLGRVSDRKREREQPRVSLFLLSVGRLNT